MPGDPSMVCHHRPDFHRSTDGGNGFTLMRGGLPADDRVNRMALAVSPGRPGVVYVLVARPEGRSGFGVRAQQRPSVQPRSTHPGLFGYRKNSADGGQKLYDMALAADPGDAQVGVRRRHQRGRAPTGGSDWTIKSGIYRFPIRACPTPTSTAWRCSAVRSCGSDGGICNFNGANDWFDLSAGLDIMQFYRFGGSGDAFPVMTGAAQDNGTNLLDNGVWTHVFGADGVEAAVDPWIPTSCAGAFRTSCAPSMPARTSATSATAACPRTDPG